MSQGEQQPTQPAQQPEVTPAVSAAPLPVIGDDQWNKDLTAILTSNANNAIAELGYSPNVLHALKLADGDITKLKTEKKNLENKCRDLSAHLALANNRIDFSKQDVHAMWKEVIYYREKYHVLQKQHQEVLRSHAGCATGPPERPYFHLLQELEKLQDMYRHMLGQNTTLKFEVQRLMQHCVNAGLVPLPQSYAVTPLPAFQPPAVQSAAARRVSEPAVVGHQPQAPGRYPQGAQPGQVQRQFVPPSNPHARTPPPNNPTVFAGPTQAYNHHRTPYPHSQQSGARLMPPPQQQSPPQPQTSTARPRLVIDLTNSNEERAPKRPRIASDPNVYSQPSPGSATYFQHQMRLQTPSPAPHQVVQQRNGQQRPQLAATDHVQNQPTQQYHPYAQRFGTAPANLYQYGPSSASPLYVGPQGATNLQNIPIPPMSAPPVTGVDRTVTGEQSITYFQGQPPDAQGQVQGDEQSQQVHAHSTRPINFPETSAERSSGISPGAPLPGSNSVSPQAMMNVQVYNREGSPPPLTEGQIKQMRSELADAMFTEPEQDDEMQARTCVLCQHRRELGYLHEPPKPLLKATTEEMYSHVQAQHPESLEVAERDWKMELFGMGQLKS